MVEQFRRRECWLVFMLIIWGTLLGVAFLVVPIQDVVALGGPEVQDVPPYPTVPPQPTVIPPVTERLDRGETLDKQDDLGLIVKNESCLTDPLTATIGIYSTNPITSYFPITGSFEAFGGYRYMRIVGTDCSDPTCAHLITAKFFYTPTSASEYNLWYWDWWAQKWRRVNEAVAMDSQTFPDDAWTFEVFNCDGSVPGLEDLSAGIVFAWGYTTTGPVSGDIYLPIIYKDFTVF